MSFISYQPNQQEQYVDEYTTSDEKMTEREEMQDTNYSHAQSIFFFWFGHFVQVLLVVKMCLTAWILFILDAAVTILWGGIVNHLE